MIPLTVAAVAGVIVSVLFLAEKLFPSPPAVLGDLRSVGKYGGPVQVYDGKEWRKVRVPAEHIAALAVRERTP